MKSFRLEFTFFIFVIALILCLNSTSGKTEISGIVFEDTNKNLKLDPNEKGIANVLVSNQREVVKTDANGHYSLPIDDDTIIFVTKPAGYAVPLNQYNLPQFYYIHKPQGSPPLKYKGIEPTGPLPSSLNFPLFKTADSDEFEILVFADTQPGNLKSIEYLQEDVLPELIGTKAEFCIALGDNVSDNLSLYDKLNALLAQLGIPMYKVPGNHDMNYDVPDDRHSLETFKSIFGPNYYSFDYGKVHFVVLDDVEWHGKTEQQKGWYQGMIGETQLQWLKNDLRFVPADKLVVLTMHIPFTTIINDAPADKVMDREKLFEIIKDREHLLALAGHNHTTEHYFLGPETGWQGKQPLHLLICATACGSWWSGPKDERGIPIADQQDGTPNGYHLIRFSGTKYYERFKPASRCADYQLRISSPSTKLKSVELKDSQIVVNVFNGNERSIVKCQIDDLPVILMKRTNMIDPYFNDLYTQYKDTYKSWVNPVPSKHICTTPLPQDLKPGFHKVAVTATDQYGNTYRSVRIFEIE
ncbi:MAG: calcineurin-like phosphoesterase family protein [Candidatus Sumerlaeia bacterium]|nr:calcineurin-like phosphoesterase family protein [Candidatus Sumerlaeia bacterium]